VRRAKRERSALVRVLVAVETIVLVLAVAFLVFGRAGFVGSPLSYVVVSGHSMEPGLRTGDVVVLLRSNSYRPGEVIGYQIPKGGPGAGLVIIHRIIGGDPGAGYVVKGDNKNAPDPWRPHVSEVVGHRVLMVPEVGLAIPYIRSPLGYAAIAAIVTVMIALGGEGGRSGGGRRKDGVPEEPQAAAPGELPDAVAGIPRAEELPDWFVRLRSGQL